MYSGWSPGQAPSNEWIENTNIFLDRAFSMLSLVENDTIKCPCAKCRNYVRHKRFDVEMHLCKHGFRDDYRIWTSHGEGHIEAGSDESLDEADRMDDMLVDLANANPPTIDDEPTASAQAFYRMVSSADQPVHESTTHTTLSAVARLLALKSHYNMSIAHFEANLELLNEILPPESKIPKDFYQSKKLLEGLGMRYVKIDVCYNNCMLYYKENEKKDKCDVCETSRYEEGPGRVPRKVLRYLPITDRLQKLYAYEKTAKMMQSHKRSRSGQMLHPCDGEAWQQFDEDFPDFASDPRNVRLAVATDGFTPFSINAAPYSCWPVFVTPLNLPPCAIMKSEYIFLALVVPGPEHPGKKLNILMQPLVDELLSLWSGVETWDASIKKRFKMQAAYLWSIHDFPAYGNFSGWSTHGRLACPICLCDSKAFNLHHGHKACWFDCHRRFLPSDHVFRYEANAFRKNTMIHDEPPRHLTGEEILTQMSTLMSNSANYGVLHNWTHVSCFWQLPYFHKLLLRHNIDVMHNERNIAEAIWNTCFDIPEKTKDNAKARKDLAEICNRPSQHLKQKSNGKWDRPRAPFCIDKNDKPTILKWFQELKFPDGYAANIKRGVNLTSRKILGLKSHDYHIFMERLLPTAFRGFLPENIWKCLAELSFFYRQLCAKELKKDTICSLEQQIVVLLCKMEKIFPPAFFNPMQHLIIHLPQEARLGGPVQARWNYPFER